MTTEEINRRFAELAGMHYHTFPKTKKYKDIFGNIRLTNRGRKCSCGVHYNSRYKKPNPNYCSDPRLVLEVMMKRDDWPKFLLVVGSDRRWCEYLAGYEKRDTICIDYISNKTGQLVLAAIKWMEENQC